MAAMQTPSQCLEGFGPSIYPDRSDPCKICYTEISAHEQSLTHVRDPCYTAFHAECLAEWLPHAADVSNESNETGKKDPSCPNCRLGLGITDLPQRHANDNDWEMHIDARHETLELAPNPHPVESLDELRDIVGDEAFTRQPLADRRLPRPIRFDEIPIPAAAPVAGSTQESDAFAEFTWLGESNNAIPSTGDPRQDILSLFTPAELAVTHTTPSAREVPAIPPAAVRDLLHNNLRSLGISHYEAYHFSLPSLTETTFYIPIHPIIAPLRSLSHLRSVLRRDRAFHDPTFTGRWLRPAVHSTQQVVEGTIFDQFMDGPGVINDVVRHLPDEIELEGWALYLSSSIDGSGLLYAVPVVSACFSPASTPTQEAYHTDSEFEEGEIVTGLLCDGGVVDTREYWSPDLTPTQRDHLYGSHTDIFRQHEIEIALYDRIFEAEVLRLDRDGIAFAPPRNGEEERETQLDSFNAAADRFRVAADEFNAAAAQFNAHSRQVAEERRRDAQLLVDFVTAATRQLVRRQPEEIVAMEGEYDEPLTPTSAALVAALAPYGSRAA